MRLQVNLDDAIDELLSPGSTPDHTRRSTPAHPAGWEPGIAWDGNQGTLTTGALEEAPKAWDDILRVWGLDPAEVEIIEPVQLRAWDAQSKEDGIKRMFYYRASVRRKRAGINPEELLNEIKRWRPRKIRSSDTPDQTGLAYLIAYADTQLGKPDGDGTEGTIKRILEKTDQAVDRLKDLRRIGRPVDTIYIATLGDHIEGFNSQGGNLAWRNELTLTEQVRVWRRLLLHVVKTFAPLAGKVVVAVVPGNHDDAVRTGGQMSTRYDDSWAIDAASAVADALKDIPGFEHVTFMFPKRDELTLTLDIAGTIVGFAHGHQTKGKTHDWWAKQAHGLEPIGDATLLLTGHYHHLKVDQSGAKAWIQAPALDGGSTWWRHRTGQDSPSGIVTLTVGHGSWGDLAIL